MFHGMRTTGSRYGVALGALTIVAAGCRELTAPPPAPLTVAGNWSYIASNLTGSFFGDPIGCEYELRMSIDGTGPTFAGTYRGARLVCDLFGTPQLVDAGEGDIVGGTLSGSAVQFDFDTETIRNTGTLSGEGMTGDVAIQLVVHYDLTIDTVLVTGPWSATR